MMGPQTLSSLGNETWYLFGDNYGDEWNALLNHLHVNKYAGSENTLSFGVGGQVRAPYICNNSSTKT